MDDFRKFQKWGFGGPTKYGQSAKYGCPCCCSWHMCLTNAKVVSRHHAKVSFREETRKLINKELQEMGA